jgi:hypothetical protein
MLGDDCFPVPDDEEMGSSTVGQASRTCRSKGDMILDLPNYLVITLWERVGNVYPVDFERKDRVEIWKVTTAE